MTSSRGSIFCIPVAMYVRIVQVLTCKMYCFNLDGRVLDFRHVDLTFQSIWGLIVGCKVLCIVRVLLALSTATILIT